MVKCPKCGFNVSPGAFCERCGAPLAMPAPSAASDATPPVDAMSGEVAAAVSPVGLPAVPEMPAVPQVAPSNSYLRHAATVMPSPLPEAVVAPVAPGVVPAAVIPGAAAAIPGPVPPPFAGSAPVVAAPPPPAAVVSAVPPAAPVHPGVTVVNPAAPQVVVSHPSLAIAPVPAVSVVPPAVAVVPHPAFVPGVPVKPVVAMPMRSPRPGVGPSIGVSPAAFTANYAAGGAVGAASSSVRMAGAAGDPQAMAFRAQELGDAAAPHDSSDAITLNVEGRMIHLVARNRILLGRSRSNTIVVRPGTLGNARERFDTRKVSRMHCYFDCDGGRVMLHDGSVDDRGGRIASTRGTYFDCARGAAAWGVLHVEGAADITDFIGDDGADVFLGGMPGDDVFSFGIRAFMPCDFCRSCDVGPKPEWCGGGCRPCLRIVSNDGPRETFVALWSCFNLGNADPGLEGIWIKRADGGFAWSSPQHHVGRLVPGMSLNSAYGPVAVTPYRQSGV